MKHKEIVVNKILHKLGFCDNENIIQTLMNIRYSDIYNKSYVEYAGDAGIPDLFVSLGILKKTDVSLSGDGVCYEAALSETDFTKLSGMIRCEAALREYAADKHMTQTLKALDFIRHMCAWEKEENPEYYDIPPLAMACHAFDDMGIQDDDAIATIILHDMPEHYGIMTEALPVTDKIRHSIELATLRIMEGETKKSAKKRYYNALIDDREAALTKLVNMCHNFPKSTGASYREHGKSHVSESREYIMPLICKAKELYSEDSDALSYLEGHITSVVDTMDLNLGILEKGISGNK